LDETSNDRPRADEMPSNVLNIRPIEDDHSLKWTTYKKLREAIAQMNIYDDNAQLRLDERTLSERLGISRTPLREALARLDQAGLVRIVPRRGVYIVRKSKKEILDMILAWAALESMAARLITELASDTEISLLWDIVNEVDKSEVSAHIDEYSESNIRFHQTILKLSRSDQLAKMADDLFMHVRSIRARTIGEGDRVKKSVVDHIHIIEALQARDTDRAERLVREHTLNLRTHVALNFHID